MALDADSIIDRRRLKRRLTLWRVVAVVAVVLGIVAAVGRFSDLTAGAHVARLTVAGLIVEDQDRIDALEAARDDDSVRAVVVRIDSPGGSVVGGESLYLALRDTAAVKPVVVVMDELAASAAYMVALGADHIVARSGTLTGSIGVLMQSADVTGLLEKLGIKPEAVKSAPLKAQPNPLEPFTEDARQATRAVVMDMYDMFVDMVAERRGMERTRALALADGRIYTGRQALADGLIDTIGGEDAARRWLETAHEIKADLPIRDLEIGDEDDSWFGLARSLVGKTLLSERLTLDGLVSLWQP
jgi:protease-4